MYGRFAQYQPIDIDVEAESALRELDPQLDLAGILNQREPRYNLGVCQQSCPLFMLL
jgi:hypothetical protein